MTVPSEQTGLLRILDASANRAAEGLRVAEDYCRFALDDRQLTELCKQFRHDLAKVLSTFSRFERHASRETQTDVGVEAKTTAELKRADLASIVAANLARVQQSLRTLEEVAKALLPASSPALEKLRYRSYTLERAITLNVESQRSLANVRLYVLLDGRASEADFAALAKTLVVAGVDAIQLRDKQLNDRALLGRARVLRELTLGSPTLFIMNDRPDLTVLARADGVHVGQDELTAKDVRAIVGPRLLVGVSTHTLAQARQAVLDGASYLGVGPVFASTTKSFEQLAGLNFARAVAAEISLPSFAIGGITAENARDVFATGISRIAVSSTVCHASDPAGAVRKLRSVLT